MHTKHWKLNETVILSTHYTTMHVMTVHFQDKRIHKTLLHCLEVTSKLSCNHSVCGLGNVKSLGGGGPYHTACKRDHM